MPDKAAGKASHDLQFNVAQLLKQQTGARRVYDVQASDVPSLDKDLALVAPLEGRVQFTRIGSGILVAGELETTVELECTRCLAAFETRVGIDIEEEFRPTMDVISGAKLPLEPDQDLANLIDERHILDLSEVVRQDLLLSLPTSPVCRPDCLGLCPMCGQNRNEGTCQCETEEADPRWAALREKFKE